MNFDKINKINVDMTLSVGGDCRPAESMRRNKVRFFSSPFDWMMRYPVSCIYEALKNKGNDFFADYEEHEEECKSRRFRFMVSRASGMVGMHHFRKNIPLQDAYFVFRYTMDRRFGELDKLLTDAKSICFVSSRKISLDDIKEFLQNFKTLYSFDKVYFINIHSVPDREEIIETAFDNVTVYECFFNDIHPDGADPKINPKFWKGNMEYWDNILSKIIINSDFVKNYRRHKVFDNMFPKNLKGALKTKYLISKSNILRVLKIKR